MILGSAALYHISRTSTGTVVHCVVSVGLVLEHECTISYQKTGTGTVFDYIESVGLVMEH